MLKSPGNIVINCISAVTRSNHVQQLLAAPHLYLVVCVHYVWYIYQPFLIK